MSYNIIKSIRIVMVSCDKPGECALCRYIDNNEKDLSYILSDVSGARRKVISIRPSKSEYVCAAELIPKTERAYVIAKKICVACTSRFNERINQREK